MAFENEEVRYGFSEYYTSTVELKDYNSLIDQNPFFEIAIKNKEGTYEAIIRLIRDSDYTTGNLLDYEYFLNHYKLIAIDLSKQAELKNLDLKEQINFIGKLEQNATIFLIIEKKRRDHVKLFTKFCRYFLSMYKNGRTKNYKSFRRV